MIPLKLSEIAEATGGQLFGDDVIVTDLNTDTRTCKAEQCFLALKGGNFDAHDFIQDAVEAGAKAVVCEHPLSFNVPHVVVNDTRIALGKIAHFVRLQSKAQFVGLTGSVGKTTVKEMVASVLTAQGNTLATLGNFNNDIGVPLTLLRLDGSEEFAVIEMGANHPGEIGYTASIVKPKVALINNVAAAHLEGFGDLQGVAQAKGEIYSPLGKDDIAVVNRDDAFAEFWLKKIKAKVITFGMKSQADVYALNVELNHSGFPEFELRYQDQSIKVQLSVPGKHNVMNALATFAITLSLGIDLKQAANSLSTFNGVGGRLQTYTLSDKHVLIDDTYNANYTSLVAAIDVLVQMPGRKYLALGDMGELGKDAREYHEKAGRYAKSAGVDELLTIGVLTQFSKEAFGDDAQHFSSHEALSHYLQQQLKTQSGAVLVKGSRGAHMEKVVEPIKAWANEQFRGKP